ncbi:hypothetical protein, partial [Streptomyces mirabilis]|uniref:hypothetical protein n=1 Tax=Streptomyces mirabilis TaxID=68239 RepID=UPI0035DDB2BA
INGSLAQARTRQGFGVDARSRTGHSATTPKPWYSRRRSICTRTAQRLWKQNYALQDVAFSKLMRIPESLRQQGRTYRYASLRHPDLMREEGQGTDAQLLQAQEEFLAAARAVLDGDSTSQ